MKKTTVKIIALMTAAALLGSCSQNTGAGNAGAGNSGTPDALINEIVSDAAVQSGSAGVDLDLTLMSGTMIYATVYNIVSEPEKYKGKTVKLSGYFDTSYNERLDTRYYFIVIPDATACCTQGLEFMCSSKASYPDDYPKPGTDIELSGVIDSYDEEGNTFYYIRTDDVKQL